MNLMKRSLILISLFFIAAHFPHLTMGVEKSDKKLWTILVFLNADNNLEEFGYKDVQEMERVGSSDLVNVVVQFDGVNPLGTKRFLVKKTDDSYYQENTFHSPVVEDMPEQDMGDVNVFRDFVTWGMEKYPAEHYAVIMWNHGSGWRKSGTYDKGISFDDTSGNYISTNQLADGIDEILAITGNKIDVFAFDACLMAMLEIADSISGMADYLVASEDLIPGDGFPYFDLLKSFYAREDKSAKNLSIDMVETYGKSYSYGSQGKQNVTLSAVDLSQVEMVKRRLNKFVSAVEESGMDTKTLRKVVFGSQRYFDSDYRDLGDYVQNILSEVVSSKDVSPQNVSKESGVVGAGLNLIKAIQSSVVAKFSSAKFSRSQGLSIYIPYGRWESDWVYSPWHDPTNKTRLRYLNLKFSKTTAWPSHLDLLFPKI
ncbi:MAG: hypothetical protein J0L93_00940 [Deltaproteobacteria bacterium]|nr:hypothetical protein [Deltaproteobacteria bacterium]